MISDKERQNALLKPPRGSDRERDILFHGILAGGAKLRLLEAMLDLGLIDMLGRHQGEALSAGEICRFLKLIPTRGWKFLHLCAMSDFLTEANGQRGEDSAQYTLSPMFVSFFGNMGNPDDSFYFRELVAYWRYLDSFPASLAQVVRGAAIPPVPVWPPQTPEAATQLEHWMNVTSAGAMATITLSRVMDGSHRILDVGGGDASIGIGIVQQAISKGGPVPEVTVFNLPASAELALANIAKHGLEDHVKVHVGDFLKDELPTGFDRVLFCRVLTDWTPDICEMLLKKAKRALSPGGQIIINEAFCEGNWDYAIAWEMRYLYYDSFGRHLFKQLSNYKRMLENVGCRVVEIHPMRDEAFYSVVVAEHL